MEGLSELLFGLVVLSFIASFFYMVKGRGVMSALFWTFIPMRFWFNWATDGNYDDNPAWLDHVQLGLIAAWA
ncbi:MAG TPA: hypothetical protein VL181_06110, partial [Holophagaceae bacterium]|nr:hypothetical protein [Holophagaceae bacterium]